MSGPGAAAGVAGETAAEHIRNALQMLFTSGRGNTAIFDMKEIEAVRARLRAALAALDRGEA